MGELSTKLSSLNSGVKAAVENCFASVNPRVIFTLKRLLPISHIDVVPAAKKSNVIYKFQCQCESVRGSHIAKARKPNQTVCFEINPI